MKKYIVTVLILCWTMQVFPADLEIRAAEIVGYGIFDAATTSARRGFSGSSMARDDVRGVRFLDYTTDIPGELGLNFGFQYVINSSPKGRPIRVTSVIKFPEQGMQRPKGRLYTESRDNHEVVIGEKALHGYGFDEEWEIVPGTWVFELWHKEARLIKKTFQVLGPDPLDDLPTESSE